MYLASYISFAVFPVVVMIINQKILNLIQSKGDLKKILNYLVAYIVIVVLVEILENYFHIYEERNNREFEIYLEKKNIFKVFDFKLDDFEKSEVYDVISRVEDYGAVKIVDYIKKIFSIVKAIITLVSTMYMFSKYSKVLLIVIVVVPAVKLILLNRINKEEFDIYIERTPKERRLEYLRYVLYKGIAFKELLIFNTKKSINSMIINMKKHINNLDIYILKKYTISSVITDTIEIIVSGMVFYKFVLDAVVGKVLLGDITMLWSCIDQIKANINDLFSVIISVVKESMYLKLYFDFMDIETLADKRDNEIRTIESIETIEFRNVSYMKKGNYILENISFFAKRGDVVRITGGNGSGKSTLLKLILGLYCDYKGEIFINGIDFKKIDRISYYKNVSAVFQDYFRFEATLEENIAVLDIFSEDNHKKVNDMLKGSDVWSFLDDVKYDDMLGDWFDGRQLSIGQWQKIAILRAMYKDADLYAFDEFDSAIDNQSREGLYDIVNRKNNSMIFVVSHRLSENVVKSDFKIEL